MAETDAAVCIVTVIVVGIVILTISGERSIMFYCEMCGSGDCCERTDIHGGPILCDKCYMEAKRDQEDKDAIEEIFKDN